MPDEIVETVELRLDELEVALARALTLTLRHSGTSSLLEKEAQPYMSSIWSERDD